MKSIVIPALFVLLGAASVDAATVLTQPVHTSKTRFRIPYRYDAEEMRSLGAVEIRLYVSVDRGRHWRHTQTVAPAAGRFDFIAPGEGEYWFSVRTLDDGHRLHPPGAAMDAGLKVIVDYTSPEFQIALRQLQPGRVEMSWNALDRFLDAGKLRLEYRQTPNRQWRPVSVVPQASGRTLWSVPQGGIVTVRGSIGDLASNIAHAEAQTQIAPALGGPPRGPAPQANEPIAIRNGEPLVSSGFPRQPATNGPFSAFGPGQNNDRPVPTPTAWPDQYAGQSPVGGAVSPQIVGRHSYGNRETGVVGRLVSNPLVRQSPIAEEYVAFSEKPARSGSPNPSNARIVGTDSFEIDYEIGDVGPSGVGAVEFYITQNDGAKWWKFGDDLDRRSPFRVKLSGDGTYGFAIRVRSGVGLATDPPQPGENPSIIVIIDQTPPVVGLYPVQQGQGASLNRIMIRWKAEDENPAEKSVSLAYSAVPNGPWTPISDWHIDAGSFMWTVGDEVPASLYIALSVRDAAGNVQRVITPNPVVVDLTKPSAKIVGVQSSKDADRR